MRPGGQRVRTLPGVTLFNIDDVQQFAERESERDTFTWPQDQWKPGHPSHALSYKANVENAIWAAMEQREVAEGCTFCHTPQTTCNSCHTRHEFSAVEARKPFSVDPKLPLEISHTDVVDVPVRVTNDSADRRRVEFGTSAQGLRADGIFADGLDLLPNGKGRKVVRVRAGALQGEGSLLVTGTGGADKDSVLRTTTSRASAPRGA